MPLPLLAIPAITAGAGLLGGLLGGKKKPPKYNPVKGMYEGTYGGLNEYGEDVGTVRGYLNDSITGKPIWDRATMEQMLAPGRGIAAGQADLARERANERAVSLGVAPRSGQYEATLGAIDRAELGANRAGYTGLMNQEALLRAQRQQVAAAQLQNLLNADLGHRTNEEHMRYQGQVNRSQVPSQWQSALSGAVGGFMQGLGAMGGMGGGGGGNPAAGMAFNAVASTPWAVNQFPAYSPSYGYSPEYLQNDPYGYMYNAPPILPYR